VIPADDLESQPSHHSKPPIRSYYLSYYLSFDEFSGIRWLGANVRWRAPPRRYL